MKTRGIHGDVTEEEYQHNAHLGEKALAAHPNYPVAIDDNDALLELASDVIANILVRLDHLGFLPIDVHSTIARATATFLDETHTGETT